MANEINKLNIGGTEYPIYSEGVKLSSGGAMFLTTSGTSGNQKIGVSDAIIGNIRDGIQIKSASTSIQNTDGYASHFIGDGGTINVTSGQVTSNAGDSNGNSSIIRQYGAGVRILSTIQGDGASYLLINDDYDPIEKLSTGISMHSIDNINMNAEGNFYITSDYTTDIFSPTIHIGGDAYRSIADKIIIGTEPPELGDDATDWRDEYADREIIIGANWVNIGDCATDLSVGSLAANVNVGLGASTVKLGSISSNIEIGNAGIKFVSNKISNTNIYNNEVHIGYADDASVSTMTITKAIRLGTRTVLNSSSTTNNTYNTLYLGANTYPMDNGTAYKGVSIGSSSYKIKDGYFYNLYYAGSCTKSSDERLKIFGDNLKVDFDALANIRKANYTWKDTEQYGSQNNIGVSAQELREVYPEFVVEDSETGLLSVDYSGLSVVALAAIDELHKENVELKSRLDKLEALLTKITEQ